MSDGSNQFDLFGGASMPSGPDRAPKRPAKRAPRGERGREPAELPQGFRYQAELISADEERELVGHIATLPLKEFEFHGYTGKRRVISFGWRYDFNEATLQKLDDIPPFLLPLRERAAAFAGMRADDLQHALITEYSPGAAIGWHRDKAVFDEVVGVSLGSTCPFRFRRKHGPAWQRVTVNAGPRSVYLLSGPARSEWEHSIPAVEALRYSVTFRSVKQTREGEPGSPLP